MLLAVVEVKTKRPPLEGMGAMLLVEVEVEVLRYSSSRSPNSFNLAYILGLIFL